VRVYNATERYPLDEDSGYFKVSLRANNQGIQHTKHGNCPEPTLAMHQWLIANCKDDVYFSHYEPINDGSVWRTVTHFEVYVWFSDANQAMMFKLTWGGV